MPTETKLASGKISVQRGKLPSIQVLRGIAAALVVFYHYEWVVREYSNRPSWIADGGFRTLGAAGVDLFFVISGFIMVYTTTRKGGGLDAVDFLRKRAIRIYPLYWVWTTVLLAMWVVGFALKSHHYTHSFLVRSYLLIPTFDGRSYEPFLSQGWTLSFEMLFYIVFSIGILINFKRWKLPFLCGSFALLALVSRALPPQSGLHYLFSEPIIIEFLFGVLAAELVLRLQVQQPSAWSKRLPAVLIGLGVIALLSTGFYYTADQFRFAAYGIPALCIVAGAALLGSSPRNRMLVYLGDASYSIYLTHSFFSMAYGVVMKRYPAFGRIPPDVTIVVAGVLTIAAASLTYPLVERRITETLSSKIKGPKKPAASELGVADISERPAEVAEVR